MLLTKYETSPHQVGRVATQIPVDNINLEDGKRKPTDTASVAAQRIGIMSAAEVAEGKQGSQGRHCCVTLIPIQTEPSSLAMEGAYVQGKAPEHLHRERPLSVSGSPSLFLGKILLTTFEHCAQSRKDQQFLVVLP